MGAAIETRIVLITGDLRYTVRSHQQGFYPFELKPNQYNI